MQPLAENRSLSLKVAVCTCITETTRDLAQENTAAKTKLASGGMVVGGFGRDDADRRGQFACMFCVSLLLAKMPGKPIEDPV